MTAGVGHCVDSSFEADPVHLATFPCRHAAPCRQGAVVAILTICLEAHLVRRTFGHNKLKCLLLLQDGAVVAKQVVTKQ